MPLEECSLCTRPVYYQRAVSAVSIQLYHSALLARLQQNRLALQAASERFWSRIGRRIRKLRANQFTILPPVTKPSRIALRFAVSLLFTIAPWTADPFPFDILSLILEKYSGNQQRPKNQFWYPGSTPYWSVCFTKLCNQLSVPLYLDFSFVCSQIRTFKFAQ